MTSWTEKGYMNFMYYKDFRKKYAEVTTKEKFLLTFIYFTGSRPAEAVELTRKDVYKKGNKIVFRITTLKRGNRDRKIRLLDWKFEYDELKEFWEWIKPMPDDYYIFGWVKMVKNPRAYFRYYLGYPPTFFRHNILSLLSLAGASKEQLKLFKGSKSELSIMPYLHLSKLERDKLSKLQSISIKK